MWDDGHWQRWCSEVTDAENDDARLEILVLLAALIGSILSVIQGNQIKLTDVIFSFVLHFKPHVISKLLVSLHKA